jgi:hypothetical protein
MIGAPMLFAGVFAHFLRGGGRGVEFPAAPWYLAAALLLVSIAVAWPVTAPASDAQRHAEPLEG